MTAEIAILNRTAVASAADSAVTIGHGENAKTYLSENKLFEVSERKPVGLLIYNSLDFYGTPWEVLVKDFRSECGHKPCDKIRDWTKCFLEWLNTDRRRPTSEQQDNHLALYAREILRDVKQAFDRSVLAMRAGGKRAKSKDSIDRVLPAVIAQKTDELKGAKEVSDFLDRTLLRKTIDAKSELLKEVEDKVFDGFPLVDEERILLRDYLSDFLSKWMTTRYCTGVVVAGFGDKELFPSLHHIVIDGVFDDVIRYFDVEYYDVDRKGSTGTVFAFAQPDVAQRFLYGIDTAFENAITEYYTGVISGLADPISETLGLSSIKKEKLVKYMRNTSISITDGYLKNAGPAMRSSFFTTIKNMVRLMPKKEMADFAEALVNITITKRRASAEMETVGGPIDVAVISRHEGFVWVKRKFYFDPKLNARYFWRKFGNIPDSTLGGSDD